MLAHGAYTYYIKEEHPCSVGTTVPAREIRRPPRVGISPVCNSEPVKFIVIARVGMREVSVGISARNNLQQDRLSGHMQRGRLTRWRQGPLSHRACSWPVGLGAAWAREAASPDGGRAHLASPVTSRRGAL